MKATIRDVAFAAGVSPMAVSYVLHGAGRNVRVSQETAARIRLKALELNYQPNTIARSLCSRKTKMIGVACQQLSRLSERNPYYPQILNGIMAALFPEKYTLALCPDFMAGLGLPSLEDGRFDGVLWARPHLPPDTQEIIKRAGVPIVVMHAAPDVIPGISTFSANNAQGMHQAVNHLAHLGHQKITFLTDDLHSNSVEGALRRDAFVVSTKEHGVHGKVWKWDRTTASLAAYLDCCRAVTAIVCFCDSLAGKILVSRSELGICVPKDLSVIGFDSNVFCERTTPRLTSIFQPVEQMALEATQHLMHLIKSGSAGTKSVIPARGEIYECRLDVRDSTTKPHPEKLKLCT